MVYGLQVQKSEVVDQEALSREEYEAHDIGQQLESAARAPKPMDDLIMLQVDEMRYLILDLCQLFQSELHLRVVDQD